MVEDIADLNILAEDYMVIYDVHSKLNKSKGCHRDVLRKAMIDLIHDRNYQGRHRLSPVTNVDILMQTLDGIDSFMLE